MLAVGFRFRTADGSEIIEVGTNSQTCQTLFLKNSDARIVGFTARKHLSWPATYYNFQWKIYPADSEIFETFRQPKVYPHYDKDNSMQISVKIMQNLIENEEDFIAQLPPSLRGYETPTNEIESFTRGNFEPREYYQILSQINAIQREKIRQQAIIRNDNDQI